MASLETFFESSIRTATPLLLAAIGETIVERAGMINIGLEGIVIGGAFGALVGATHGGTVVGVALGMGAGVLLAALFYLFVDVLDTDQIVTGTAITILALGLTGALYRTMYGASGAALTIDTIDRPVMTCVALLLGPATWWWLYRTHAGLSLRAIGESPAAAVASGIPVARYRFAALCFGGALGGLAGATLVVSSVGTFAEGMSAGRGFIAIAVVVLGRWNPIGVMGAGLVFGAAMAAQYWIQAMGLTVPYPILLSFPYLLTLAALAGIAGRVRAPAALSAPLSRSLSS